MPPGGTARIDPLVPPPAGTYTYRQSGFASVNGDETPVPEIGTLVVEPASADGVQTWRRYIDPAGPPSDVVQQWTEHGVHLVSGVQRQQLFDQIVEIPCEFTPRMLVVPWPVVAGWSNTGTCDCGAFTPRMELTVADSRWTAVGGRDLEVHEISSVLRTEGAMSGIGTQLDWVSWDLSTIYTHQQIHLEAEIFGVRLIDHLTSDLIDVPSWGP